MSKLLLAILFVLFSVSAGGNTATAQAGSGISTEARIVSIGTYNDEHLFYIIFDRPIRCFPGSTTSASHVQFVSKPAVSTAPIVKWDKAYTMATAALLSQRPVIVSTLNVTPSGACLGYALDIK